MKIISVKNPRFLSIGQRLRNIRKRLGYSQKSISSIMGTTQSNYSKIERGLFPPNNSHIMLLREYLNINPDWILKGTPPSLLERSIIEHFLIPIFSEIPDGPWEEWIFSSKPRLYTDYIFHPKLLQYEKYFGVKVKDNSMKPLYDKGDIVVIDPNLEFSHGIAVVCHDLGYKIRNVFNTGERKYYLCPLNKKYNDEEITAGNETHIYVPVNVISIRDI